MIQVSKARGRSVPVCVAISKGAHLPTRNRAVPIALARQPSFNVQKNKLLALADKLEVSLRRKFKAAINAIKDGIEIKKLASLIERGASVMTIMDEIGLGVPDAAFSDVRDALHSTYNQAGALTAGQVHGTETAGKVLQVTFNGYNQRAVNYLQTRTAKLITDITEQSRQAVTEVLTAALENNIPPISAAKTIRAHIGLTDRQRQAVNNYQGFLQTADRRAFNRSIGGQAERTVTAAFRDDTMSQSKIRDLTDSYSQRLLNSRADTIARTETFRAVQAANMEAWNQVTEQNDLPTKSLKRFWVATNDERTRDAHLEIVLMNEEGVGMNEPFQSPDGPIMYPGDPNADPSESINCRCTVVYQFTDIPTEALMPQSAGRSFLPGAKDFTNQTGREEYD